MLYVGGKDSILAYADSDPADPQSPIILKQVWHKPAEIVGGFNSMNMTYDGWLVSISDDGWVVLVSRDFSQYHTLQLTGADVAAAWNQYMLDSGRRQGRQPGCETVPLSIATAASMSLPYSICTSWSGMGKGCRRILPMAPGSSPTATRGYYGQL